ncbi:DUF5374 domain-containing protein [Ursidibacter maritimus]|uniref:DUF5374 domain-containing protein n=1 Tax=Ursidibacter maritimus TaxID=1331689 RepID=A0A949WQC2_9PAST|nr:DUF5374 domain-containing protein [Ursidibacter maritimus]KAE9542186.1 hypothetical protein A1D26_08410 [Ursidibacter maritimus]MBV6524821.1 DUF5374 domain-containing protein [Ursidibacter maritimus]MBV6526722.1 DUF5374 domain-containing protein [Ursidibacter maritimus]MBV6528261.1 DUF5374 domain-containing protein [Ursidibacter maritimus]MBV6530415.1 DUF5374 domain-containing protein [Ursidibacter maritimus]
MIKIVKAETLTSLLIAISLFMILFLAYANWQSLQNKQANYLYQKQQALQIAENQLNLKAINEPCEKIVKQNNLNFEISCLEQKITVIFPLGKIELSSTE